MAVTKPSSLLRMNPRLLLLATLSPLSAAAASNPAAQLNNSEEASGKLEASFFAPALPRLRWLFSKSRPHRRHRSRHKSNELRLSSSESLVWRPPMPLPLPRDISGRLPAFHPGARQTPSPRANKKRRGDRLRADKPCWPRQHPFRSDPAGRAVISPLLFPCQLHLPSIILPCAA